MKQRYEKIYLQARIGLASVFSFMTSFCASEKGDLTAQIEQQLSTWHTKCIKEIDQESIAQVNKMINNRKPAC